MKGNLKSNLVKILSIALAFVLVFPTEIFAMAMKDRKSNTYQASRSIMGLATSANNNLPDKKEKEQKSETLKSEVSIDKTKEFTIEKSANLSKSTGKIDYRILVKTENADLNGKQVADFSINQNTDLVDLKVEKVTAIDDNKESEIKYSKEEPEEKDSTEDLSTFAIASDTKDSVVYYISAQLSDKALADIDKTSPNMSIDFSLNEGASKQYQDRFSLELKKSEENEITIDQDGNIAEELLEEVEDSTHLYKGQYKEEQTGLFNKTPAQIKWSDYINPKDNKEFTYNIKLDDTQDTKDSKIKIDYYQAGKKGYELNKDFSQTVPFAEEINLQIPQGYIARIEFTSKVKANTNPKSFSFNKTVIKNPTYKEEKTESNPTESDEEDPDPLSLKEDKKAADKDSLKTDQSSKENAKSPSSIDSMTDESDQDLSKNSKTEPTKEKSSAIALNKDAYISNLKENNKLSTNLENATKQIVPVLESYNKEEINWDDFKASIQNIAKAENIDSAQAEEIISALLRGLNEDKYKVVNVDIKEATNFDQASENALTTEEIKALIKEEFAKEKSGQITEEELEASLASIREENNITNEDFFNILRDLYKNDEIANDSKEDTTTIKTDKTKEEALAEKLAEENLSTEDFIAFLQSYVKSYDIKEDQLESLLKEKQVEVEKVIGDFTIDEIVAAAFLDGLNPHIFAAGDPSVEDSGFANEDFKTELEYYTETLTRATNEDKLFEIVRSNSTDDLSDQEIRNDYVGWKINIPGTDNSGNDITEFKKDKYEYDNLNFSIYAPAGQSLEDYKVVVEDGQDGITDYSGSMTEKKGEHYIYSFSIPKNKLTEKGYNIYVVAKEPKKRQNYAIGVKISPDKNYVNELVKDFDKDFEELSQKYPFLIKWKDTSAANPYRNGINLIDTRMVYLEPKGWQDLFPYNGFRSLDYNDNIDDTDIMKNRVSMFGNIKEDGQITWTISETFPAERLVNKNTVGIDAYSAKTDGQGLTGPSVQILVPNDNGGYDVTDLGNVAKETLQEKIGNKPGTIVNYTFTDKATNKEEFTTLSLDSGKSASIAYKPSLLQREEGAEKDTSGLAYLHKVQEHKDGSGYEVALSNDQANTMKAFIPKDSRKNPRFNDPNFKDTGVIVFCLNPGKPEPTRQYKFNGTITKGEWSTAKKDWVTNGKALAALATANEAKSSPLYKGTTDNKFYASLYEYLLRMYWYGQEMAEEYQLDEQSYYKIIQYNLYYWLAGENYAENFRNMGGYNPNYFSSAEYSYATGLKNRIEKGKDWDKDKVDYDEEIQFFYYGHDKTRSFQNTITGDTKRKSKKGSVTVNKVEKVGEKEVKKLPGAYFQLLDAEQNPIRTLVTDENGVAVFDDLDYGTYYIKEVQGPKGYQFKEEISDAIVVGKTQAHYTFNYKNKKNEIEFRKVNEKGLAMDGVVFELSLNGRALSGQDQISGKDGKFSWKELTPGNYQVVEKDISKYPEYSENEGRTVASFRVDENNIIQDKKIYYPNGNSKIDIKNEKNEGKPIGIEFTKVDLKTENPLEGAEFVLEYRKPDSSIFRELPGSRTRSNSQGKLVWNDLVDGDYRVIETKAPGEEYETDINLGEKATFTVTQDGETYSVSDVSPSDKIITNQTKPKEGEGSFEFEKIDEETKEKLQGVEFTLESINQVSDGVNTFKYKTSKTSDAAGKIKFDKLLPGEYKLTETKKLPGYKENTRDWKVVVAEDGSTKVYDDAGNDLTMPLTGNYIFENNGTVLRNKSKYTLTLKETNDPKIVDLELAIEPQKTTKKATIYYVYDDDKNKNLINDLAFYNKVDKIIPIKVNNKDEYKRHIQTAYLSQGLANNSNGILVSYITKDYANSLTQAEINLMVSGKKKDVDTTNKPLFAYYKNKSNNLSTIYNTGAGSHGFYKDGVGDNPDFKELIEFINSGALGATDKNLWMEFTNNSSVEVDDGVSGKTFNTFFRDGNYLIPGKTTVIKQSMDINPELLKNFSNGVEVLKQVIIREFNPGNETGVGSDLPVIKMGTNPGSGSTTIPGSGTSQGFTISNEKEEPEKANLTIRKYDSGTNKALEGAKFELYQYYVDAINGNNKITTATTNEFGYAVFEDSTKIKAGEWYFVKEVEAPLGYKISGDGITQVKASSKANNEIDIEIPNDKINARFEIYKKDKAGNYLEGAEFRLLDEKQQPLTPDKVATTDKNGYALFDNLEAGKTYYLEETKSPEGYLKNPTKLELVVEADGNIKWEKNNLVEEEYNEPEYITKQRPLDKWRAFEDNVLSDDPSYLNTREYAELINPETGELHYYVMLKAQDFAGNGTNVATEFIASTQNADIKKIELFEAGFYSSDVKKRIAHDMKEGTIADNKDLFLANAPNTNAGDITMEASGVSARTTNKLEFENSADKAIIRFPNGRFDGNWAYIVKVTANVKDASKNTKLIYRWQNSVGEGKYLANYQEMPPLKAEVKVRQSDTSRFTVINEKRPSINFVKEDVASGKKLYGAEFVLNKDGKEVKNSLTSSDADGKFGFDNLEDGSYTVYETVPPEGYPYAERFIVSTFTVENGKVKDLKTNQKYGEETKENFDPNEAYPIYNKINEIKFKKVGKDKQALAGAKFKLDRVWDSYDDSGKLQPHRDTLLDIKTLDDGIIALSATEPGRYQLVETYAPKGYQQIKTNNKEKGEIVAEFTVERGSLDIKNVLVGNEYIQDMTGKTDPLEIVNKEVGEGKFQVNKVKKDGNTTNPLTGAKFLLKDMESDQYVNTDGTLTTNSGSALTSGDATVNYENLTAGKYELREFKSPDGYVRTINTWNIVVAKDGKTTIIENEKLDNDVTAEITPEATSSPAILKLVNKSNEIEFTKIDSETKKPLKDVEFEIWWDQQGDKNNTGVKYKEYVRIQNPAKSEDAEDKYKFTTDNEGKFKLTNLGTGHYKIYETKIPKDYKVTDQPTDNEPIAKATGEFVNEFYVDMDGDIKKNDNGIVGGDKEEPITTIKNTPITGKFRVQKVGEDGVEKLDGAEFALYKVIAGQADKGKSIKQEVVKDSDGNKIPGRTEFADLKDGQYLLEETKAPDGYVMSTTKWEVTVEDGRVNISSTDESSSFTRTDDTLTLNVVNKKPTYPSTGGNGPKIALAIIGTAIMLAAIAYYGIKQNDKNRRKADGLGA